ncbi:hypothetical protein ACKKBF_B09005 [Auxenochlorella protothecoides x Auxenochlorella symbiontica]|uniref:Glycosyltransferase-like protein LARGE2 n=1 Tax=Auxenochlorella protothecoides TaxID=3075 RepID=A0A1D2A9A8_AUXPR|nr:hypothetical protein APUTEX25_004398 [Auxenochlorella protothecoides]|eukprot:RMZ55974.1 hypothetical protein APUTEX25_004398 [Auxenochlorella protothecoides]
MAPGRSIPGLQLLRTLIIAGLLAAAHGDLTTDDQFLCPTPHAIPNLPILKTEASISSGKERAPTDVTLVTQLSFERLYMLEGQCDVWSGTISAAVYIALVGGKAVSVELNSNQDPHLIALSRVVAAFRQFHELAEQKGICKLDLQLVSQEVENVWLSGLYPVNSMRNRALANAKTDVVLLLDVDFWPSAELVEVMAQPRKYESLRGAVLARRAIVLPAFEPGDAGDVGVEVARGAVLGGKAAAAAMSRDGRLKPFHTDRYRAGHRATDYARWLTARTPYHIRYEEGYEPYVLVARRFVPWYDERFVGYRKNKVVHLLHLAQQGTLFVVHPNAFTVHSPHPRARTWKVTRKTGLWDQLATIYREVKEQLAAQTYVPAAMYSCGEHVIGPLLPGPPSQAATAATMAAATTTEQQGAAAAASGAVTTAEAQPSAGATAGDAVLGEDPGAATAVTAA